MQNYDELTEETFRMIVKKIQKETGVMGKELWIPVRLALTGRLHGPDLPKVAQILGKEKSADLIRRVVE